MSQLVIIRHTAIMTLVLLLSCAQLALAQIQPGDAQRQAAVEVAESLRYGHYADAALDDAWSQLAFERYLDTPSDYLPPSGEEAAIGSQNGEANA